MKIMELYRSRNWLYWKYEIERLNSTKIAQVCDVSRTTIVEWMKKFNIKRRDASERQTGRIATDEARENMRNSHLGNISHRKGKSIEEEYGKERAEKIREKNRNGHKGIYLSEKSRNKISESLKGNKHRLKYHFNEKAFDILTPQTIYWLGFIYADGYINGDKKALIITLHEKDEIILEEFKYFLHASHSIWHDRNRPVIILSIYSDYLFKRLCELGLYQNKHETIAFPTFLPEYLYSDFIRGYLDGDGSLTTNGKICGVRFEITSNPSFLTRLQKILMQNCNLKKTKLYFYKGKKSASLSYGGKNQVKRIINYLIQNDGFYLPRKIGRWL